MNSGGTVVNFVLWAIQTPMEGGWAILPFGRRDTKAAIGRLYQRDTEMQGSSP